MSKLDRARTQLVGSAERRPTSRTADDVRRRVQRDLEERGIASGLSVAIASRLSAIAGDLSPREYTAVLDGIAATYGVSEPSALGSALEIRRLVEDFAVELQKLDEGLRTLSAYLLRIRERAVDRPKHLLH